MLREERVSPAFNQYPAFLPPDNPTFRNPPFGGAPYRVLIARLSPFRDVDRSLPHLYLYQAVRRTLPDAFIDLAFFPTAHEREAFDRHDTPYLIGTQSRRGADAFDLVLISNAYTLELINLPILLLRSGIPLYASERGEDWPILLLGGSNALAAQAAIRPDGDALVDGIFFGEGEGLVGLLVATLFSLNACHRDISRRARLQRAAKTVSGLWVAGSWQPTAKAVCPPGSGALHLAVDHPLLNSPEVHTASLQINYGCPAFCSFCFEGYDRKPYREVPLPALLDAAQHLKRAQGVEEINLYSFNFNTHAEILPLLLELHRRFYRVGLKSQRVDILQHTPTLLEAELAADKRSYTLGIEGISARQRAWLHKSLPTADIVGLLERLFAERIREIKLFFILTGHEDDDDLAEFRAFVRQVKAIRAARNRGIRVIFSFGLLIRMPFTPLRYDRLFLDEQEWRHRIGPVKSACETNGFEFRQAYDWPTYCTTQVLALGGYGLNSAIVSLAREGRACVYDTDLPQGYWEALRAHLREAGHWDRAFLGEKGPGYPFPLDFVTSRISDDFLYQQYEDARAGLDTGYCLGGQDERGRCLDCSACATPEDRRAILRHRMEQPEAAPYLAALHDVVARKRRLQPLYYRLRLDPSAGVHTGIQPALLNALAFRALLAQYPDLAETLLAVRESLFTIPSPPRGTVPPPGKGRRGRSRARYPVMPGESIYALYAWDPDTVRSALTAPPSPGAADTSGLTVLSGPLVDFTPGAFAQAALDLHLPARHFPDPRRGLEDYLHETYVPYSLRREDTPDPDARRYRFDLPAKALKKKLLLGGHFTVDPAGLRAHLLVGPRFNLLALLGPSHLVPLADARISGVAR